MDNEPHKSKKKVSVTVERAENGFTLRCFFDGTDGPGDHKQYIYETIDEVAKELPALFSVSEAESPDLTEEDLEGEKKKINKGEEY